MAETVGEDRGKHGGDTVSRVPGGDADRLLGSTVPLGGDEREGREARVRKEPQQEPGSNDASETGNASA
jgi:hypothetical protein